MPGDKNSGSSTCSCISKNSVARPVPVTRPKEKREMKKAARTKCTRTTERKWKSKSGVRATARAA